MKSSTLRRSNLTKEKLLAIELLSKYRRKHYAASQTNIQPMKDRELDILWQNLKHNAKYEKSPAVYIITGFILGAVSMLILTTILSLSVKTIEETKFETVPPAVTTEDTSKLTFIPADTTDIKNLSAETYTVQKGDTLESIVIRFYGSYTDTNAKKIEKANGLANPNSIVIGQKLNIPLN